MKRLAFRLGIDKAVFFTLLGRFWNVAAGLLTILAVAHFLSPELQGYYYTFNSLIALQIFVELGLNFAIIQFASHEMAHLYWLPDGTLSGDSQAKRRLQSLLKFAFYWFSVAALLMMAILLPLGLFFFGAADNNTIPQSNFSIPWSLLVMFTAISLFVSAASAILEGCGKVAHVALLRLWQSVLAVTLALCTLALGGQLYALVISSLTAASVGIIWLFNNYRNFFKDIVSYHVHLSGMSWSKEIWPFHWRIAVSWMSGYLIFQLFTPLIFKTHGAVAAGQMGMSLQIINALNAFAMVWISTKAPVYGQLIVTNQRAQFDALFFRGLIQSFVFLLLGVTIIWFSFAYMIQIKSYYIIRILPLPLFTLLCLVCLANHVIFAEASYLRAHKEEPFMVLSLLNGILTATLAIILVPSLGLAGAVYSYAATNLSIGLVGGSLIFFRKRKKWVLNGI
jgi:O-antigen/teichoic acid export membrane protein